MSPTPEGLSAPPRPCTLGSILELIRDVGINTGWGGSLDRLWLCSGASKTGHTLNETCGEMNHLEKKSLQSHNGKTLNIRLPSSYLWFGPSFVLISLWSLGVPYLLPGSQP